MRIVVIARTLNEEHNVGRFIGRYWFADEILVADGGSVDGTVDLLLPHYPKVQVRLFDKCIECPNNPHDFMNPEADHVNFLINWAENQGADWIIMDDVDCWPTPALHFAARDILERTTKDSVYAYRLYLWKDEGYFPQLNEPGQSLWAWQPARLPIRARESYRPHGALPLLELDIPLADGPDRREYLEHPYCLVHDCWPDDETIRAKMKRYWSWGHPQIFPTQSCGPVEPLPDWARW